MLDGRIDMDTPNRTDLTCQEQGGHNLRFLSMGYYPQSGLKGVENKLIHYFIYAKIIQN